MDLLQLLLDFLVLGCPRLAAVLLVLAAALFGFCAYIFFVTAQWVGGIVFLVLTLAVAALLVRLLHSGDFRRSGRTPPKR